MSCTQKQQLVCFPKVRVYKPWFRHFNDHKDFRNEGTVHLFSLMALFSYANFRSNERVINGDRYMEAPGQWICKLGALPRILRVHSKAQALTRLVVYGDRISSGMSAEIMKAEELGIPVLQRPGLVLEEAPKPVIVGRCINGVTINGLEYLQNDDGEVLYFKGITAAKDYLREHEVTDEEMEDIVLRESVGTCIRCGDPLFPSDISGYAYQCFKCDEDFYAFEQGRNS